MNLKERIKAEEQEENQFLSHERTFYVPDSEETKEAAKVAAKEAEEATKKVD
jgi:hypothetical protein